MALRDKMDIEIELNAVLDETNRTIANLEKEAAQYGKVAHDYRNQNGDPTIGPLLNIKANALHTLAMMNHECH